MKIIGSLLIGLVAGVAIGWYWGYTRPAMIADRDARRCLGNMESDDRMTAVVALAAIRKMEDGRSTDAEELLARQLGSYYVIYGPPDNPKKKISDDCMQILRKIEEAAKEYPVVQAALDRSKQIVK